MIDVLFRKGDAHSNHGSDYTDRVEVIVKLIRKRYSNDVPTILCAASGFADQKATWRFVEFGNKLNYWVKSWILNLGINHSKPFFQPSTY